jgi:HD-GYP domain-containing protein (c-di-GMP phosphodiesterase class II)
MMDIQHGSLLHDIGKIGVPDAILLKPGQLTAEEWKEIRKHPEIGYHILKGIDCLHGATQIVLQHHERFDGAGYPLGLARGEIQLGVRIVALADTFDAITSDRPYRRALNYWAAHTEIIACSDSQFDPELVDCFLRIPKEAWLETKASA